ncbi:MAG: hypothetical protein EZS28_033669 [Streblomastix strix]|uniref:Uncharacterized protein n=1 Tax=Streblomastix strix TaxID=222440 RepID=A0A5J4UKN8_9EUKA|nr:MAG: hypothetical protein EZS28_033669 [Streblomastix strix]
MLQSTLDIDQTSRFGHHQGGNVTDRSYVQDDLKTAFDMLDNGDENALLEIQRCAFNESIISNPKLAQKSLKKLAKKFFNLPNQEISGSFAGLIAVSASSSGHLGFNASIEIFLSILFGMLEV